MSPHFTDEKLSLGEIREFAQGHAAGNREALILI